VAWPESAATASPELGRLWQRRSGQLRCERACDAAGSPEKGVRSRHEGAIVTTKMSRDQKSKTAASWRRVSCVRELDCRLLRRSLCRVKYRLERSRFRLHPNNLRLPKLRHQGSQSSSVVSSDASGRACKLAQPLTELFAIDLASDPLGRARHWLLFSCRRFILLGSEVHWHALRRESR
jgi:hypothetical protein